MKRMFALLAAAALLGCGQSSTEPVLGTVTGTVKDDLGSGISGVSLMLTRDGKTPKSATSSTDGRFTFANVQQGTWKLEITAPNNYEIPRSQSNPAIVAVGAGSTTVNVTLQRKTTQPPGPGGPIVSGR